MADADSPNRKGRALNVVSTAVIVYVLAGGHFTEKGFLGGGMVRFDRPDMLEPVGVILFGHFLVRFLTPRWRILARSVYAAKLYMRDDPHHRKNAEAAAKREHPKSEPDFSRDTPKDGDNKQQVAIWRENGRLVVPVRGTNPNEPKTTKRVPVKLRDILWPATKAGTKTILFQDAFREDILPLLLASGAILCVLGRWFLGW